MAVMGGGGGWDLISLEPLSPGDEQHTHLSRGPDRRTQCPSWCLKEPQSLRGGPSVSQLEGSSMHTAGEGG